MIRKHSISFRHAIRGIYYTLCSQPNMRVHYLIGGLVIIAGAYFGITKIEWIVVLFTVFLVIMAEMINTSIESVVDLVESNFNEKAKLAKDVSAGMVLLSVVGAVIVGLVIFLPYVLIY